MTVAASTVSTLLDNLPAVLQEDRVAGAPNFLGRFLLGFEHLLLGVDDAATPGLEESIARIYRYFEPGVELAEGERAPREFLDWLAGWVALTLREDWDELRQRDLIAKAASLYRWRGTKRGMEEFLRIYTRPDVYTQRDVRVEELSSPMQIGVRSRVGVDTLLDGGAPFFFRVYVTIPSPLPEDIKKHRTIARAIIDLQKPAHTYYTLIILTPTFQVAVHSTVGVDTLVG